MLIAGSAVTSIFYPMISIMQCIYVLYGQCKSCPPSSLIKGKFAYEEELGLTVAWAWNRLRSRLSDLENQLVQLSPNCARLSYNNNALVKHSFQIIHKPRLDTICIKDRPSCHNKNKLSQSSVNSMRLRPNYGCILSRKINDSGPSYGMLSSSVG